MPRNIQTKNRRGTLSSSSTSMSSDVSSITSCTFDTNMSNNSMINDTNYNSNKRGDANTIVSSKLPMVDNTSDTEKVKVGLSKIGNVRKILGRRCRRHSMEGSLSPFQKKVLLQSRQQHQKVDQHDDQKVGHQQQQRRQSCRSYEHDRPKFIAPRSILEEEEFPVHEADCRLPPLHRQCRTGGDVTKSTRTAATSTSSSSSKSATRRRALKNNSLSKVLEEKKPQSSDANGDFYIHTYCVVALTNHFPPWRVMASKTLHLFLVAMSLRIYERKAISLILISSRHAKPTDHANNTNSSNGRK